MISAGTGVALVVGTGNATGAAVGRRFAAGGYAACLARRSAEKAAPHVERIVAEGGRALTFGVDARNEASVVALFDPVEKDVSPVEICLFNASANTANTRMLAPETIAWLHEQIWRLARHAGFLTGGEAVRRMLPRGCGTLLVTGATASLRGDAGFAAFAAAKAGLRATVQSLAREFSPRGIHVAYLVIEGSVDSPAIHARPGPDAPPPEPGGLVDVDSVATAYRTLHTKPRDGWTNKLDLRPSVERW
jgi:NAD(P)-dependent dehydrogenase (short-subunit alcohol dehydrogenase family)